MGRPRAFVLALLLLCAVARGAPNADPTATFPTSCPGARSTHGLPGLVAAEQGRGDGSNGPGDGTPPRQTDGGPGDSPAPYAPVVTPPPDQDARLASQGYRQETFYTCNTVAGSAAHCGWHVPLVKAPKAGGGAALSRGGPAAGTGAVAAAVACLAGLFALGMM
ncbi:hypothetical protein TOPH_08774 [Tolypocladium ophioglossoides CBS 100239]|uniref:Uncharacterized protein n=1 Tax=Tolypocladium ophioglossoides (strain CBS 100239) TaxID=1163406 RepID=A0A0L0MXW6_TOLOC|nr:hypothetical protein TOPH_08774 [Tolypocladium ophioglossoides CBS 100239]